MDNAVDSGQNQTEPLVLKPEPSGETDLVSPDTEPAGNSSPVPERVDAIFEHPGEAENRSFGTFNGVFRPTILTILGVMMYLREGWVVGNAGLLGAVLVILACYLITGTTALSISSAGTPA